MKTTPEVRRLCSFLSSAQPRLSMVRDLAHPTNPITNFSNIYLGVCLEQAARQGLVRRISLPEHHGSYAVTAESARNCAVVVKGREQAHYTSLDRVVDAGVPTLVEMRMTPRRDSLEKYLCRAKRKHEVLMAFYGENFAHVLMLSSDHGRTPALDVFEGRGGKLAVVPYTSQQMQKFIRAHAH